MAFTSDQDASLLHAFQMFKRAVPGHAGEIALGLLRSTLVSYVKRYRSGLERGVSGRVSFDCSPVKQIGNGYVVIRCLSVEFQCLTMTKMSFRIFPHPEKNKQSYFQICFVVAYLTCLLFSSLSKIPFNISQMVSLIKQKSKSIACRLVSDNPLVRVFIHLCDDR